MDLNLQIPEGVNEHFLRENGEHPVPGLIDGGAGHGSLRVLRHSADHSGDLPVVLVKGPVHHYHWSNLASQQPLKELTDKVVILVIIASEAVIQAATLFVQLEPQVVAVNDDLGVSKLLGVKKVSSLRQVC